MASAANIRALHGARSRAGLSDEDFRDRLQGRYGTRHVSALSNSQLKAELTALSGMGSAASGKKGLAGPYAKKLQALWLSGWNLGLIRDRRDQALLSFVERQTGIERTEFLREHEAAAKAVEALKKWLARDGGVDWTIRPDPHRTLPDYVNNPQFKIVTAQVVKLQSLGHFSTDEAVNVLVKRATGHSYLGDVKPKRWIETQQELGEIIRGLV